jgi:predicted  nucleic acid-binding Zn ribbon protein
MFDAELTIRFRHKRCVRQIIEIAWQYANALHRRGQIADDYSISSRGNQLRLLCIIPERRSLELKFHDKQGKTSLRQLKKLRLQISAKITGVALETAPACSCRRRSCLHLFTHMFDDGSPLQCGDCRRPVAFYQLPRLDLSLRQKLLGWQADYQACDSLFISSGFAEMWAYRQMSRHDSGLTKDGRELCEELEVKVRLPVFYYLLRHWGQREEEEQKRRCPSCGKSWFVSESAAFFCFRCKSCSLISSKAVDFKARKS